MKIRPKLLLTFLFVLAFLLFGCYRLLLLVKYSADIGGSENSVVYFVQRVLAGFSLYGDPQLPPFSIAQYPPLYYYCVVSIARLTGVGPDHVLSLFMINRVFGLFCNLLYLLSVFFMGRRIFSLSAARSLGLSVLCFIFLESPSFARPDSLNLAVYLWSLFFFLRWIKNRREKEFTMDLFLCALLCGVSLFIKQTSLVLPFIICLWLLLQKKYRSLLAFAGVYGLTVLVFTGGFGLAFGLKPIYQNTVLGIDNGISLTWFWDFTVSYLFGSYGTIWILIAIAMDRFLKRDPGQLSGFCRLFLAMQFFSSLFFSLKWGSWISYFTEWWTLLFLMTGFYWDEIESILSRFSRYFPQVAVGLLLSAKIIGIIYPLYAETRQALHKDRGLYDVDKATADWIIQNKKEGFVFNNNSNIHLFLNNLLYRDAVLPQYEIVTYTLYKRGIFNYDDFTKSLGDGRVQYLITDVKNPQTQYMDIDLKNFKPVYKNQLYMVYQLERKSF